MHTNHFNPQMGPNLVFLLQQTEKNLQQKYKRFYLLNQASEIYFSNFNKKSSSFSRQKLK